MRTLLLVVSAALGGAVVGGHEDPVSPVETKAVVPQKQNVLAEMWQRRILATDQTSWSPEDMHLLERMRSAERLGALGTLRRKFRTLKGYTVTHRPAGAEKATIRLTRIGYDKYLLIKSQEALQYFESKEIPVRDVYRMTTPEGKLLFDAQTGHLTDAGDVLYTRALLNLPVEWKLPSGELGGNRPPKRP